MTIKIAKTPNTVKYPSAFIFSFMIRLFFHKINASAVSTTVATIYLFTSSMEAIPASSCRSIPPKMIEKNLENTAKKVKEYA